MRLKLKGVGALLLSVVMPLFAQSPGNLAEFHVNRVKPGLAAQYEAARKKHWEWHKKQKDTWSWHTWEVVTGEKTGSYIVASFGHNWQDLEAENATISETPDPAADVDPYLTSEEQSYYEYRPDLSSAPQAFSQAPLLSVTHYFLNSQGVSDFLAAQKKINEAKNRPHDALPSATRWYEIVDGGEIPHFVMAVDRPNWAAFQAGADKTIDALMEQAYGKEKAAEIVTAFRKAIRSTYVEAWQYRPDLSMVGGSK